MRCGIMIAAALIAIPSAAMAESTATSPPASSSTQQQQYCGFNPHPGSIVECGYSSRESCESAIGKGAMCFVNPYIAMNTRRPAPLDVFRTLPAHV
jgi:Protein of unknown function (DUF3551)